MPKLRKAYADLQIIHSHGTESVKANLHQTGNQGLLTLIFFLSFKVENHSNQTCCQLAEEFATFRCHQSDPVG